MKLDFKKKIMMLLKLYGTFFIILISTAVILCFVSNPYEPKYKSENYPKENGQQNENSVMGTRYNYYLDTSPSMIGFFGEENNTMSMLANILDDLNQDIYDNKFYTCYRNINNVSEEDFYENMFFAEQSSQHYQNFLEQNVDRGDLETEQNNLDLSKIFTENYDNGESFNDSGTVNMIITDMNFINKDDDVEYHNMLLERFANHLVTNAEALNFCMYNVACEFKGMQNNDNYTAAWDQGGVPDNIHSFFIIVLAKDNNVYSSYINKLENLFTEYQIDYSNNKWELKNNLFENQNKFAVDRRQFVNLNNTILENFNFDNKSRKKMPENAVGVRFIRGDSNIAALRMQIASFELSGYVEGSEEYRDGSIIDTIIKIYYPYLWRYNEYTNGNIIERNAAYLEWKDGVLWLIFEADFNMNMDIPHGFVNDKFYIVDIQFTMLQPAYTIPEWISSINVEEIPEDWKKKIHINSFVETIIAKKREVYEKSVSEEQRYMGNLLIYVNQ